MKREKKRGLIMIVIGICIPLLSLPFVTGFDAQKGIMRNVYETGIPLQKTTHGMPETSAKTQTKEAKDGRSLVERFTPRMIPLRYLLALGVFLIFIGIVKIDRARKNP
jgi:hypothetical protein